MDLGTPYLNSDGSVYMFDPSNPPRIDGGAPAPQPPSISSFPSTPQHELFPGADLAKLSLEVRSGNRIFGSISSVQSIMVCAE